MHSARPRARLQEGSAHDRVRPAPHACQPPCCPRMNHELTELRVQVEAPGAPQHLNPRTLPPPSGSSSVLCALPLRLSVLEDLREGHAMSAARSGSGSIHRVPAIVGTSSCFQDPDTSALQLDPVSLWMETCHFRWRHAGCLILGLEVTTFKYAWRAS